jgi:hypothetical protein
MLVAHARQAIAEVEADAGRQIGPGRLAALRVALRNLAEPDASADPATKARPGNGRLPDR